MNNHLEKSASSKSYVSKTLASFSEQKRKKLLRIFEGQLKDQQSSMASATNEMVKLAPYKLAFVISKHKCLLQAVRPLWSC